MKQKRIVVLGATGFVGRYVSDLLDGEGFEVIGTTRNVARAREQRPDRDWRYCDVDRPETLVPAFRGADVLIYLVHEMAGGPGYEAREAEAARQVRKAAEEVGIERIVYLGGMKPSGPPSRHLESRLATGEALRAGATPTFELRAGMIVGEGSASFRIVRDLASRLPVMILPRWLASRSEPVDLVDIGRAVLAALTLPDEEAGVFDVPGPEVLTAREILVRTAAALGIRPGMISVPILSPHLSSLWIRWVTRANYQVARELVEGLTSDVVSTARSIWDFVPDHRCRSFDESVRAALVEEDHLLPPRVRSFEAFLHRLAAPVRPGSIGDLAGGRHPRRLALSMLLAWMAVAALAPASAVYPILAGLGSAILAIAISRRPSNYALAFRPNLTELGWGIAVGVVLVAITHACYVLLAPVLPSIEPIARELYAIARGPHPAVALALLLPVVLAEEVLYRGQLLDALRHELPAASAIVLGSLLYALAQAPLGGFPLFLAALGLGLVWTLLRLFRGNLVAALVSHLVWDVGMIYVAPLIPA